MPSAVRRPRNALEAALAPSPVPLCPVAAFAPMRACAPLGACWPYCRLLYCCGTPARRMGLSQAERMEAPPPAAPRLARSDSSDPFCDSDPLRAGCWAELVRCELRVPGREAARERLRAL